MSKWENLKKNISRTGGGMFKGDDLRNAAPDLFEQAGRFEVLKKKADRLLMEARNFLGSVKKMSLAQKELAQNLAITSSGTSDFSSDQHKFAQASTFINDNIFAQFEQVYSSTVLEPIETYCSYLPDFQDAISKTRKRLQDLEKAKSQLGKATSKAPDDPRIINAGEDSIEYAENVFEALRESLVTEIPKLINARIFVAEPSFKALVRLQLSFFQECLDELAKNQLGQHTSTSGVANLSEGELDNKMNNVLQQIRDLDVCNLNI